MASQEHPLSLDSSPAERRALKFKVFTFYGKWEPHKSVQDVNDLCEWALSNGVSVFNSKLRSKYGEDLSTVSVTSYLDLPIDTQLKLFSTEFDANKNPADIEQVAMFAHSNGANGLTEINTKMNHKYGENLNTLAFGGRVHMRVILDAYFRKCDPLRCTPENINVTIEYVVMNGSLALIRELMERYKVPLQLSVNEIQKLKGKVHEIDIDPAAAAAATPARPAVVSLMRGQAPPVTSPGGAPSVRPLSLALKPVANANRPPVMEGGVQPVMAVMSVSEDAEIKGLMEVFYAKNNPEKLATGGVDALMKFCRVYGVEVVNQKLREKYDEDLNTLRAQYEILITKLTTYYADVDPDKKNIEDIAAWAIVHGQMPLSERLKKRYGKGLFGSVAVMEPIPSPPAAPPASPPKPVDVKLSNPLLDKLQNLPPAPPPPAASTRALSTNMEAEMLRAKLTVFYKTFDSKPKSTEDLNTIVNWVVSGASIVQLNKKLKDKYGKTLDDVADLPADSVPAASDVPNLTSTFPAPEEIRSTLPASRKASSASSSNTKGVAVSPAEKAKAQFRERSDSVTSDVGSTDGIEEQMNNMRKITSGQYEQITKQIRAFYRRYDPSKVDNKEALDLVMKWTFKHGPEALNKQFEKNYGKALNSVQVDDKDEEAEEEGDVVDIPDW